MKYLLLILGSLFSFACARPDYLSQAEWDQQNKPANTDTCQWKLANLDACAHIQWLRPPTSSEPAELTIELAGNIPEDTTLSALLWMPSMGHGSAPVQVERLSASQYRITKIYFIMPGDWEVRISFKNSSQVLDQLTIPLMVP